MGLLSKEEIGITGDGYSVRKGKTYYHITGIKVKVKRVFPLAEGRSGRMVEVTKKGRVFADTLYQNPTKNYIGSGD